MVWTGNDFYLFAMKDLERERFHFAVEWFVIHHECWFVLKNFMNDQSWFTWFFSGVTVGSKIQEWKFNLRMKFPRNSWKTCKFSKPHKQQSTPTLTTKCRKWQKAKAEYLFLLEKTQPGIKTMLWLSNLIKLFSLHIFKIIDTF